MGFNVEHEQFTMLQTPEGDEILIDGVALSMPVGHRIVVPDAPTAEGPTFEVVERLASVAVRKPSGAWQVFTSYAVFEVATYA